MYLISIFFMIMATIFQTWFGHRGSSYELKPSITSLDSTFQDTSLGHSPEAHTTQLSTSTNNESYLELQMSA